MTEKLKLISIYVMEIMVMMTTTMTTVIENHFLSNASAAHS
jgi:predicted pyridoxine 5'-phosphate oxidase superfamily flavin-nucleotide-binding protein